jgi:hypothetical protein
MYQLPSHRGRIGACGRVRRYRSAERPVVRPGLYVRPETRAVHPPIERTNQRTIADAAAACKQASAGGCWLVRDTFFSFLGRGGVDEKAAGAVRLWPLANVLNCADDGHYS